MTENGPASPPVTAERPEDPLLTWPRSDIVANQRAFLLRADQPERPKAIWRRDVPDEGITRPPPLPQSPGDASSYSVYRYTRGIDDLANSGMGYGETTQERRCVPRGRNSLGSRAVS